MASLTKDGHHPDSPQVKVRCPSEAELRADGAGHSMISLTKDDTQSNSPPVEVPCSSETELRADGAGHSMTNLTKDDPQSNSTPVEVPCSSEADLRADGDGHTCSMTSPTMDDPHIDSPTLEVRCPSEADLRADGAGHSMTGPTMDDPNTDSPILEVRCPSEADLRADEAGHSMTSPTMDDPHTDSPTPEVRCPSEAELRADRAGHSMTSLTKDDPHPESQLVEVYCPSEAELRAEPQVNVQCIVEGCNKIFSTSAARNIHVIQTHKIYKDDDERQRFDRSRQKSMSKVIKHFYCPVSTCNRSIKSEKPFSRLSLLKQHYYILHAEKKYPCEKCEKRFSTQRQCITHQRDCGKSFFCSCGEKCNSMTALYMHAKRKRHMLPAQFVSKRRKPEQVKEKYVLIVPVPFGNPQEIHKTIREPVTIVPHPASFVQLAQNTPFFFINNNPHTIATIPATATTSVPDRNDNSVAIGRSETEKRRPESATTSTQTDESEVRNSPQPKQATSNAYAQTAHSCFPSFIPMLSGPKTFKRHKKTLAIQTHAVWPQGPLSGQMSSSETQTLDGQDRTAQTQTVLDVPQTFPSSLPQLKMSNPLFPHFPDNTSFNGQQTLPSCAVIESGSSSVSYNYRVNSSQIQQSSGSAIPLQNPQSDTNSTQTPWNVVAVNNSPSASATQTMPPLDVSSNLLPPNEVLTQTDLTFQNLLEYNTSETQTFSEVNDAMTDTCEPTAVLGEEPSSSRTEAESLVLAPQSSTTLEPTAPDIEMSGLDLLFLASTEHRASCSLDMPRIDDAACCQQTQTAFDTDTGHQQTQTVWDWSLDEFSFLDQYTQTAVSASTSTSSTSTLPETDRFSQTGLGLYSQFAISNTETQTVSVFDLEMFGNSISVQTESGSGAGLLGDGGLEDVSKEVQVSSLSQQQMVSADVQTEAMDVGRLRSRGLGSGQLASSQTQTSLWEDIESLLKSDNFTQTQFP